jgi:hypothetical protein
LLQPPEKESALVDLQRQVKLLTQKEAAFSKQQKALEAQVSGCDEGAGCLPGASFLGQLLQRVIPVCPVTQVERHKQAAAAAREAAVSKEQQVKELAKEGAKADKDRCVC